MRRLLWLALLAASLLPFSGPARAQATADQLNRLSLEALTATPPGGGGGGGGGYSRRIYRPSYHGSGRTYARVSSYRGRQYGRRYARVRRYASVRHYVSARRYTPTRYAAAPRYAHRARPVGRPRVHVTRVSYSRRHAAPVYQRWRHR